METTGEESSRDWIKQENAIPTWVALKALTALESRVSKLDLPAMSLSRVTSISQDSDDAENDANLPCLYYLRVSSAFNLTPF